MKTKTAIWLILIASVVSFFIGRQTTTRDEIVRYVKGETVRDSTPVPYPVKEYIPSDPKLIYKDKIVYRDTGRVVIREVDSLAILVDYITKRDYAFNVFDNENGKLNVNQTIQYNRLQSFNYSFTPIQKEITRYKEKMFAPFVSGSYNSFGIAGIGGGIFYKNIGIEYNYLYHAPNNQAGHMIGLKVAF